MAQKSEDQRTQKQGDKRVSLYPAKFEDALRALLNTKSPEKDHEHAPADPRKGSK